jgi:glycosyltransferase involved in cell wall biosynthesis
MEHPKEIFQSTFLTNPLPPISVYMPAYNAEKYIDRNIDTVYGFLIENFEDFELTIVDDNSDDNTNNIVKSKQLILNKLQLDHYHNGPSRRENLAVSMLDAKFDTVFFIDSDLSPDIKELRGLMSAIVDQKFDVVIGSRYQSKSADRSFLRRSLSTGYNKFVSALFDSSIYDHNCGLKGFRKSCYSMIVEKIGHDIHHKRGWFWDVEVLLTANQLGFRIKEIPVKWTESSSSTFRFERELKVIPYAVNLVLSGRFKRQQVI